MTPDPIVEEVHRIRREILAECGGDIHVWLERLKAREALHPERMVSELPRDREKVS